MLRICVSFSPAVAGLILPQCLSMSLSIASSLSSGQAAQLVERHLARGDAAGVHRLEQFQARRRPGRTAGSAPAP